ncbi:MAG: UDP-glucose/GDP-mannose dehydrogenase family protein [Nitrospirae bacterium]|nr:UDP-glucose/GDP-mannose dehydrogenase family protein [Nitrospirota bacterium]
MHISVIGTGYVGLVTGACFAEFGVNVTCMDTDADRIAKLEKGDVPFYEPGLSELVMKGMREKHLTFTTDVGNAIEQALVIFIAVGTPSRADGSADLSYVEQVGRGIGQHMKGYKVIATKSTVPVGTGERLREVIKAHQGEDCRFDIVSNPEFLREGSAIEDFLRPNRVIIGADSDQAVAIMRDLYRPLYLIETPVVVTNIPTAEIIKYASNAFLATKISFINEVSNLCEHVGADVQVVSKGMGLDHRIGSKFLHAGPGFGGSCFPKDLAALIRTGQEAGLSMTIPSSAAQVNENQRERMIEKIRSAVGNLKGKTFGILGLSFKPNTDDLRESPAIAIAKRLLEEGCSLKVCDPVALAPALKLLPGATPCQDAYDVAIGADALVLLTEWNQFRNLDLERIKTSLKSPLFIDLRNVYEPSRMAKAGFRYVSVGRQEIRPS